MPHVSFLFKNSPISYAIKLIVTPANNDCLNISFIFDSSLLCYHLCYFSCDYHNKYCDHYSYD